MPMVGKNKFPYTKKGMADAARAKKKQAEGGRYKIQPVKSKRKMG